MDRSHAAGVKQRLAVALAIAGSDSGGGAGIQADLKTFAALSVHGASVVTALTAQNTRGVRAIHYPPPAIVAAQIEAVLEDFVVSAIKIGMLGSPEIVGAVGEALDSLSPRLWGEGWAEGQGDRLASSPAPHPALRATSSPREKGGGALRATFSVRGRRPSSSTIRSWSLRPGRR
jgi:hydroxymethylpyrimidine/phosphomethylpyrimidine kinase